MFKNLIENLIKRFKYAFRICQHTGCWRRNATPCGLPDENMQPKDDVPDFYFCWEHAHRHGFCHICGQFFGGIESFDFGSGLCDSCDFQIHDDFDDYEEDDYYPWIGDNDEGDEWAGYGEV